VKSVRMAAIALCVFLWGCTRSLALNPSLNISQYAHTSWRVRDGFSLGNIYAMAQTPDGYLWFGTEFGLVRFDGVRRVAWQPPAGQHLPDKGAYSFLVTRDGTLWIGTFNGLATWDGARLTRYPELDGKFVTSMLEDREGTVWAGLLGSTSDTPTGQLCAIRRGHAQCYLNEGAFGSFVWGLAEDSSGALWAGAESGLWRWKPGTPTHYPMPHVRISDLTKGDDGRPLIAVNGTGLQQFTGERVESYPLRAATDPKRLLRDRDVDSNKLLRDRDGGLWIGTVQHGLIHVHGGRADQFTKADGLSGDIVMSLFEDREGNIWVATTGGIDRFREFPAATISVKQGLSSDVITAVVASADGSIWVATYAGLTKWKDGQATIFRKSDGLPDDLVQSLFQDDRGQTWATFAGHGLGYLKHERFVAVPGVPSTEVYSITGDKAGNVWLSGNRGLSHLLDGHLIEHFPWTALGRHQQAKVIVFDRERGGLWLSFWNDGGVEYFKDGQVRASYTAADGLGKGHVPGLRLDRDGAVWAATEDGGLSLIKDGHITTMTTRNGLPCNTIHWSIEDNDRSLWLYTGCGLVRIARAEMDAWIADPTRRIETMVWDAADGAMLHSVSPSSYGPPFAKSIDGKLWLLIADGIQVVDPYHLPYNKLPPPVHIEQIVADHKMYWQNLPGVAASSVHLPARTRDLQIDYTALSLTAPEKVHFKYKLEGQDTEWREVVNDREVQYSNLAPGPYTFRVIACNNSGVWNEHDDTLQFSIAPAYYQTNWFRAVCAVLLLALVWAIYQIRVRQLRHDFALTLEARIGERTSIARELHDTLLQSFHGLLLRFQIVSELLPERPVEAKEQLDRSIDRAAKAITEGRDAVQGLRTSTVQTNDLARAINTLGEELATDPANDGSPAFRVTVEGDPRDLHPILRDEIYRIAAEALRNAFNHAAARQVEVEIRYDTQQFRFRVRDDGKGIDPVVLSGQEPEGHFGLPGMRERGKLIGGKLVIWSEVGAGTEVELRIPASAAYATATKRSWISELLAKK
jgi:signal transduction histidine kinase/ligand-binding sensor domain-containing protein